MGIAFDCIMIGLSMMWAILSLFCCFSYIRNSPHKDCDIAYSKKLNEQPCSILHAFLFCLIKKCRVNTGRFNLV